MVITFLKSEFVSNLWGNFKQRSAEKLHTLRMLRDWN